MVPALVVAVCVAVLALNSATARASGDPVVTIAIQGIGKVSVQPSNITCQATCTTTVSAGAEVTLTATPATGFVRASWRDACAGVKGDTCVIHPEIDTTVTAVFAIASVTTTEAATTTEETTTTEAATTTTATTTPPPTTTAAPPTIPTTPTTTTTPGPNPAEAVKAAVDALPVATIAFNTPKSLGRDEPATIQLLLSPETISVPELEQRITEAGEKSGLPNVHYSDSMKATLTSNDFEISGPAQADPVKSVAAGKITQWLWDIAPKRTGKLRLYLTLYAYVGVDDHTDLYEVETFRRTLAINVGWPTRLADFVKGNWQWLWATLVPVGVWVVRRKIGPSRSTANGGAAPPTQSAVPRRRPGRRRKGKDATDTDGRASSGEDN